MLYAKDIMSAEVITAHPGMTVAELARLLVEHRISGVPVVGDDGALVGIVTENDLISRNKRLHIPTVLRLFDAYIMLDSPGAMEKEFKKMAGVTVGEICTRDVMTITESSTVEEIATIMSERKVHLLPVLSSGKLVGIVGKADLIKAMLT
jgi:CBS domain-containing protein